MQHLPTPFNLLKIASAVIILLQPIIARSQTPFSGLESLFTTPKGYASVFATVPPEIDGDITEKVWEQARWSELFQDIEGGTKPAPAHNTRVRMLWDKSYLYIAAELQEPHIWGGLKNHDDIIYYDNDFEVFLDPDNNTHNYFEIEVNALNTLLDLFIPKPYRNNGAILMSWDAPGLRSKVKINGTLNNPADTDKSWTVEMAIPFKAVSLGNNPRIPKDGDLWRVNFSRVQWETEVKAGKYVKKKDSQGRNLPEHNWVWSPQGVINMHYPERWGYLQFVMKEPTDRASSFQLPARETLKNYLWLVYYRQKEFYHKNRKYASSLVELGIGPDITGGDKVIKLEMQSTGIQFTVTIKADKSDRISINQEGFIQ